MPGLHDQSEEIALLKSAADAAATFLGGLNERPAASPVLDLPPNPFGDQAPADGIGAAEALSHVVTEFFPHMSGSAGPRFLGFVTGGATPAAVAGDWLAAAADQNVASPGDSIAVAVSVQAMAWLKDLFGLPADAFDGAFTTGATGANFACLLAAREWAGERVGYDIAQKGLRGGPEIRIFSACPHASFIKTVRFTGLGEDAIIPVARIGTTEEMDADALNAALSGVGSDVQKIVCASIGTVTGNAFDEIGTIADICRQHGAWLHVDAAFGLFARTVPELAALCDGIEQADSITVDGHKWLNVPYDCGFYFTKRIDLVERAAGGLPAYLDVESGGLPQYINRSLEGSQRFRALPTWMTLAAYGKEGVRSIVRANVAQAALLAGWIDAAPEFELLCPTVLNVVCFRGLPPEDGSVAADEWNRKLLQAINATGEVFMTPGAYGGKMGIRAAFSNWRTGERDLDRVTKAMQTASDILRQGAMP